MSLRLKTFSGVKWTSIGSLFNTTVLLLQLTVLSRFLIPSEFGLIAVLTIVVGFSEMFLDMGMSNIIIVKKDIPKDHLNSLYVLNIIIGVVVFLLLLLIAKPIARFYGNDQLSGLITLISLSFLLQPFGQQFMVLLQKRLEFQKIAIAQILARTLSFISLLILLVLDFNIFSYAIATIVNTFLAAGGYIIFGSRIYKPKFYFKKSDIREYLSFGLFQMGEKSVNYFKSHADTIIIGKLLGLEVLGIYDLAKNITSKPASIINPIITRVTFPIMSSINEDFSKLKSIYLRTINTLSTINFPIFFLLAILAEPLISIVFGPKWLEAVPLIRIMAFTYLLRSIENPVGSLLLAKGRADIAFYWNIVLFLILPLLIYFSSAFGIYIIVINILVLQFTLQYPLWRIIIRKLCDVSIKEYVLQIYYPFIISSISGLIASPFIIFFHESYIQIISVLIVFSLTYIMLNYWYQKTITDEVKKIIAGLKRTGVGLALNIKNK